MRVNDFEESLSMSNRFCIDQTSHRLKDVGCYEIRNISVTIYLVVAQFDTSYFDEEQSILVVIGVLRHNDRYGNFI